MHIPSGTGTPSRSIRFCESFDRVRIATATYGSGPPILRAATWLTHIDQVMPGMFHQAMIDEFSRRHTYIEYDTRGCGLSQRRVDTLSFDAWVRDLEAVADASGHERFVLVAFTCAAGVAIEYAARHPERVSQMVLYGGFATSYHSTSHPDPAIRREGDLMLELAAVGWGSSSPAFRRVFVSRFMPDATPAQWDAFDRVQRDTASPDVAVRYLKAMYSINVKDAAARVRCPTLVLHPRDDQMVSFEQGRRLASLIPGARFVALPGRNHMPFADEPGWTEYVREVRSFLGDDDAVAPSARLTPRQLDVIRRVASGLTDKQIARELALSPRTVEMHVSSALRTLGCRTRAEAVRHALVQGLIAG